MLCSISSSTSSSFSSLKEYFTSIFLTITCLFLVKYSLLDSKNGRIFHFLLFSTLVSSYSVQFHWVKERPVPITNLRQSCVGKLLALQMLDIFQWGKLQWYRNWMNNWDHSKLCIWQRPWAFLKSCSHSSAVTQLLTFSWCMAAWNKNYPFQPPMQPRVAMQLSSNQWKVTASRELPPPHGQDPGSCQVGQGHTQWSNKKDYGSLTPWSLIHGTCYGEYVVTPKRHGEVLTPITSKFDLIWK